MEKLLPYYERELSMLRRAGAEFAGRYPKLAGSLQIRGEACADPHVERLIQASAFLNARVAKSLDDGYANFTEALLGMLYPHYLRPIPSCSIARIDYSGAKANDISTTNVLPRGAALKVLGQNVNCHFRTVYDASVAPVAISGAWFEPYIQTPSSLHLPPDAGSAICLTIECGAAARSLAALELPTLRVFIDGEASSSLVEFICSLLWGNADAQLVAVPELYCMLNQCRRSGQGRKKPSFSKEGFRTYSRSLGL